MSPLGFYAYPHFKVCAFAMFGDFPASNPPDKAVQQCKTLPQIMRRFEEPVGKWKNLAPRSSSSLISMQRHSHDKCVHVPISVSRVTVRAHVCMCCLLARLGQQGGNEGCSESGNNISKMVEVSYKHPSHRQANIQPAGVSVSLESKGKQSSIARIRPWPASAREMITSDYSDS